MLGSRCRALITTRDTGLLTALGGVHHVVELLTDEEALDVLALAAGSRARNCRAKPGASLPSAAGCRLRWRCAAA